MAYNPDCEKTPTFKYVRILQRVIIILLLFILSIILLLATINVVIFIIQNIVQAPVSTFTATKMMDLFSIFLVILIGIELLETVKAFLQREVIQVEIVVLVAIIAVARKVIIGDFSKTDPLEIFGVAAILIALATTYFIVRRTRLKINLFSRKAPIIKSKKQKFREENQKAKERSELDII